MAPPHCGPLTSMIRLSLTGASGNMVPVAGLTSGPRVRIKAYQDKGSLANEPCACIRLVSQTASNPRVDLAVPCPTRELKHALEMK